LLTHGDLLCTDDTRYMTLRSELRAPGWQREFLAKPLAERRQIASDLRQLSATEIATKSDYIMDVNQAAVERTMREHDVALLLHGHTHRPAVHRFTLDGRPAARIVLGAWYEQASVVRWTAAGFALETVD
jgi:UDP-2,3-diacylglucosamine hydrolase